jgi:protein TonB
VKPVYPPIVKNGGIEGAVLLEAVIGMDGSLMSLRVMNSQIDPDLAKAAVEAVSQWRYQPTLLNGVPVEVMTSITINFRLSE